MVMLATLSTYQAAIDVVVRVCALTQDQKILKMASELLDVFAAPRVSD
jgi:hypothetical protein